MEDAKLASPFNQFETNKMSIQCEGLESCDRKWKRNNMRDHTRPMHNQADDKYTNPNSGKIRNATVSLSTLSGANTRRSVATELYILPKQRRE